MSVDEKGYLTFNGFGTCTINAVYQDDVITNGKAIKGSMSFTFKQLCESITIDGDSWSNMIVGDTKTLQVTTEPANVRVSYTSNNPSVATVSSSGVITAVGEGEAEITVTDPDEYQKATYWVYVSAPEPEPEPDPEPKPEPDPEPEPVTPVDPTPVNPTPVTPVNPTPVTPSIPATPATPTTTTQSVQPQQNQKPVSGMFNMPYGKVYLYSNKTAEIVKWTKQNAKAVVPTIIVYNGIQYTVTDINSGAFKGNKKITQVVIPSTVTTIGSKAFYGCKKLKKVTVQGKKIDSVGRDAFKKCSKKLVIKVPKSKKKAYKKLFKGYVVK
ncbi:MAG: leucine-rich repeat protein [Lachnospiraceae bacterium]|nr:leucine-rich repeat protein [Lachnospiraceae bacterium]